MAGYSQNDSRWGGDLLGSSTYWYMGNETPYGNARAAGCYVTAGANVLKAFGHDITPGDLNKLATSRGLINSNGDVVRADWLAVLFPDVCQFVEFKNWGSDPADLAYFDIRNDLNTEIIVEIDDSPSPGMQTHFMRTVGWDGSEDIIVDDSWDAVRKGVSAYGARWTPAVHAKSIVYTATKYIKTPVAAPNPNITLDQLIQLYRDILNRAPDQEGIAHYVGHYTYEFVEADLKNSQEYQDLHTPTPEPTPDPVQPPTVDTIPTTSVQTPMPVAVPQSSLFDWVNTLLSKVITFLKSFKKQ